MKHNNSKRLSKKEWNEVDEYIKIAGLSMQDVSEMYKISRNSIYTYGKRHNKEWSRKRTFGDKIKAKLRSWVK